MSITEPERETEGLSLLRMLQVSDSLFPVGMFTLSNGLETCVEEGMLRTPEDLECYLRDYLQILPYGDLGTWCLARSHSGDAQYLTELDRWSLALKAPSEVRTGSVRLCSSFLKMWEDLSDRPALEQYRDMIRRGECRGSHALAMGLYAADIGIPAGEGAQVYCWSLVNAVVTNAVKTVPLSQRKGQAVLYRVFPEIPECVRRALEVTPEDLGIGGARFDIFSMNHEYLYTRQYMS